MEATSKNCSRCAKDIFCNAAHIASCDCYQVSISESTVDYLKETKYNCLCNKCLTEVNDLVAKADLLSSNLEEGIHYYIERGNYVFTELYHIKRGYCCGSKCRHCAYGIHLQK